MSVEQVQVLDNDDAARRKFLGSPSFRVNSVDLWNEERDTYLLSCRVYATPEEMEGNSTVLLLREIIHRVVN